MSLLATDFGSPLARDLDHPVAERGRGGRLLRDFRPPRSFKGIKGPALNVRFGGTPRVARGHTAAQRDGLRYERRVIDVLSAIYGADFRAGPSILYEDRTGCRMAIPDGILRIRHTLVVIEVKLSHTEKAWWQLKRLYAPLLAQMVVSGTPIATAEICRSYDPSVAFPGPAALTTSLHTLDPAVTGILQWKL